PQTQFGMVNQYTEFISISSFAPAIGDEISDVNIAPPSGLYETAVAVTFSTANPAHQVFYRLNSGGNWTLFAGTPITIFTNTTVHYYGKPVVGNAKSTIRTASYQFRKSAGVIDSDGDGVPDFVEVGEGLDPLGGADSDGDGFSDFEELIEGTDPLDPDDPPSGSPGFEQKIGFDLVVTPRPLDGVLDVETNSQTGTQTRLYDINGSLLASAVVTNPPAAPIERSAVFHDVAIDPAQELLLVVTEPHFDIETAAADKRIGRELVGLVPVPQIAPLTVDYVYGSAGGGLGAEADGWIAAAQQQSAGNEELYYTITLTRGSVAGLFERKIQQLLADHGVESSTNVSLLPFRPTDAGRTNLAVWYEARATNASLKTYNLKNILATIEALVTNPPNAQIVAFNDYAAEIYRLSSLSNNAAPGVYPSPVDSVRACIAVASGGSSPTSIGCQTMPPDAAAGVNFILASVNARPLTNINLRVRPGTFIGPCTTLETTGFMPVPVNLFDEDGAAFDLPDSFNIPPGSVIGITGHPDVVNTNCHGLNIEVVSLSLEAVPIVSDGDANGNLLIDSWEKLFLAMFGADPFGDHDGDGYSNLQEMFEGSDPTDGMGMPALPPADLSPPQVEIEITPGGAIHLAWSWPAG
ncbi:MAG TPA: hypothetical protein VNT99_16815, partial [Methylomirabilota bacterium]|nr:hypothetical protein [Methylomirabilota bacterium]